MKVTIKNCEIKHIETMVPSNKIDNNELDFEKRLIKKIIKNTGVVNRYTLEKDQSLMDLYIPIAKTTIEKLNWDIDSIDGIIVVTQTQEYQLPATSTILQGKLGLSKEAFAYDITMGCSGYIYGLYSMMSNVSAADGEIKRVLLFVGDAISTVVNKKNKSNVFLFGDAASCTAIEYNENAARVPFVLKTDGTEYDSIIIEDSGLKNKISESSFVEYEDEDGNINSKDSLKMNGAKVFNFTVDNVPPLIEESLEYSNTQKEDIQQYCFHQANKFMVTFLSTKVGINDKTPINIEKFGNTSCASIPLLLTDFKLDLEKVMLVGFGVGMSMGTAVVNLGKTTFGHRIFND